LRLYLDASVLVALFTTDALTGRADTLLRTHRPVVIVSDFTAAELASAVARRVRACELSSLEATNLFVTFDAWVARVAGRAETTAGDVAAAAAFLRRLDLTLCTPDALHVAIIQRIGAELFTFDEKMAASARALGIAVRTG
jgi:predicted nucleic acid-binding protein